MVHIFWLALHCFLVLLVIPHFVTSDKFLLNFLMLVTRRFACTHVSKYADIYTSAFFNKSTLGSQRLLCSFLHPFSSIVNIMKSRVWQTPVQSGWNDERKYVHLRNKSLKETTPRSFFIWSVHLLSFARIIYAPCSFVCNIKSCWRTL